MESRKESDVELAIQALKDTAKLEVDYIKQLRMANALIKNLQENKLIEAAQNEQKICDPSMKKEESSACNSKVTILTAKVQSNMNTLNEVLPKKREDKGSKCKNRTELYSSKIAYQSFYCYWYKNYQKG